MFIPVRSSMEISARRRSMSSSIAISFQISGMVASAILLRFGRAHFSSAEEKRQIYGTYLEIA